MRAYSRVLARLQAEQLRSAALAARAAQAEDKSFAAWIKQLQPYLD